MPFFIFAASSSSLLSSDHHHHCPHHWRRRGHAFQNIGHFLMSGAKKNWQMAILWLKVSAQETSDQGLSSRCSITTCCFGRSRRRPSFQSWQLFNNFETTLEQLWDNFGTTFFYNSETTLRQSAPPVLEGVEAFNLASLVRRLSNWNAK